MLNETINGIAQKLNQIFGDEYRIHIDTVKQGLKEPCFLIVVLEGNQEQVIGNLYSRKQSFDIHYFPQSKNGIIREVNEVLNKLLIELEYIEVNADLVRGTNINFDVVDEILHFFVNYDVRIRKVVEPDPLMEDLTIIERVKTDGN